MSVLWGIERASSAHAEVQDTLRIWRGFCEAGCCDRFVLPIDETCYEFHNRAGRVFIRSFENPQLMEELQAISTPDASFDAFDTLLDGQQLFLPDNLGLRNLPEGVLPWNCQLADSTRVLLSLSQPIAPLGRALRKAARFCLKHSLMLSINY